MPKWFKYLVGFASLALFFFFLTTFLKENMDDVVEEHLKKIREHRITQAYFDYTSKNFQDTTSLEAFRDFVISYPELSENKMFRVEEKTAENEIGAIKGVLISNDLQEMKTEYQLIREGDKWKILSIRLQEMPQNKENASMAYDLIESVDGQLKALRYHDVMDAYYSYVSKSFQKETPFQTFQDYVKSHPILFNYEGINFKDRKIQGNRGYVDVVLNSPTGHHLLKYQLVQEGNKWKVWSLHIILPPEEAAKKTATNPQALVAPVRAILDALLLGNTHGAYNSTAKEFQEDTSFDTFQHFANNYPVFAKRDLADIKSGVIENGMGKLRVNLHDNAGMTVVEFRLGFEEGQWKIWGMEMIEHPKEEHSNNSVIPQEKKSEEPLVEKLLYVIERQLKALRHQDLFMTYYADASERYREKTSLQQFENYLEQHPEFGQNFSIYMNRLLHDKNRVTMRGAITAFDGRVYPVRYELINENGSWKIEDFFSLPEEEAIVESEIILDQPPPVEKPLELVKVLIGTSTNDEGLINHPVSTIREDIETFFINVYVKNGVEKASTSVVLEHIDSASTAPPLSAQLEKDGDSIISFSYKAPDAGWPEGEYVIKVTSSTGRELIHRFKIEKG